VGADRKDLVLASSPHPRVCRLVQGTPAETRAHAEALVARLSPDEVFWPGDEDTGPRRLRAHLGRSYDAVVLDLHDGIDADLLAASHGFVRRGGALVVRMGPTPPEGPARLAVPPHTPAEVGSRLWHRVAAGLGPPSPYPEPLSPPPRETHGTAEQTALVEELALALAQEEPALHVVLARRGRGKSAALGLALGRIDPAIPVAITAGSLVHVAEALRFGAPPLTPLGALLDGAPRRGIIAVDEAARLPVPTLQRLVTRHPAAHFVFATTTLGYEGSGRGFVLRFLDWLADRPRPLHRHRLTTPIRWDPADPLETRLDQVLVLDAPLPPPRGRGPSCHAVLDRDALARDEALLTGVFGLLRHAHYRSTPGDLHGLLDAPNVTVHVLLEHHTVVAACLTAHEGALDAATCAALAAGRHRIRGHALADALVSHGGRPAAGRLPMVRSMRIVVHPERRRAGLGRQLAEAVHDHHADAALFGTLFGATPGLLAFRRALGYRLVRVGASRGDRSGEPAAVMIRPVTAAARALVEDLRTELAWNLDAQLALLTQEPELGLTPALRAALSDGLAPAAGPWPVGGYLNGPRTYDSVARSLEVLLPVGRVEDLVANGEISPSEAALLRARLHERLGWRACQAAAGLASVRSTQRTLRRLIRGLLHPHA